MRDRDWRERERRGKKGESELFLHGCIYNQGRLFTEYLYRAFFSKGKSMEWGLIGFR
jgi:hypothetical protein